MDMPRSPQLRSQTSKASLATTQARTVQSDSDSEDDAPLATLLGPRRPGSAMSSYSNLHSRSTGNVTTRSITSNHRTPNKPLIDINELTRAPQRSYTSPNTTGFTEGPTLLSQSPVLHASRALSASPPPMVESPVSTPPWQTNDAEPLTRTVPPLNFISPPASPAKDMFSNIPDIEKSSGGGGRVLSGEPNDLKRDTSPEARRDPITDRLTRAVKKNLQPAPSPGASSSSVVTGQNGARRSASRELNPSSGDASDASRAPPRKNMESARAAEVQQQAQTRFRPPRSHMPFPTPSKSVDEHSPLDEELAQLLGTAVQFISRTGNTPPPLPTQGSSESSESESDEDEDEDEDGFEKIEKETVERIAPIPIKQRSPPPSFSVTSRPPLTRREGNANADSNSNSTTSPPRSEASSASGLGGYTRPRSSTLIATSSSSSSSKTFGYVTGESISAPPGSSQHKSAGSMGNLINFPNDNSQTSTSDQRPSVLKSTVHVRQRSLTMVTGVPLSAQMPLSKKPISAVPNKPFNKPFNGGRRNSPASSTGDSSSGRAPITPRDGSDIGMPRGDGNSKQQHQQQPKKHVKRRSVSFEDDTQELKPPNRKFIGGSSSARGSSEGGDTSNEEDREVRRRERRRSEAKAAIEVGLNHCFYYFIYMLTLTM
jgi:serine/arginine repetitive matrix protein 2